MTFTNLWPDERIAKLKLAWSEGKTASQIAGDLGITRNAVLAKINRLRSKGAAIAARGTPIIHREVPATIGDLSLRQCHWPIGDPKLDDFHFCAKPVAPGMPLDSPGPYCPRHRARAYRPRARSEADLEIDISGSEPPRLKIATA